MELIEQQGGRVYVAEAPLWDTSSPTVQDRDHLRIGITAAAMGAHANRGLSHHLGQLYGVVSPGLIFAKFVFRGLKRHMMVGDDLDADQDKLAV